LKPYLFLFGFATFVLVSCSKSSSSDVASNSTYKDVQPIFAQNCTGCHGGPHPKADVDLSSYIGIMKTANSPIAVVKPGDPDNSQMVQAIQGINGMKRMPPGDNEPLDSAKITAIENWIKAGAKP